MDDTEVVIETLKVLVLLTKRTDSRKRMAMPPLHVLYQLFNLCEGWSGLESHVSLLFFCEEEVFS